jgi:predicted SnoaL-like aldol condensation-catalyzing enzyme
MPFGRANKALVIQATTELLEDRDPSAIDRYWAAHYIQHSPVVGGGLEGLRSRIGRLGPDFRYERVRAIADGDFVALHGRYHGLADRPLVAVNMWRVADGRLAEHWEAMQPEAGPNPSGHTMLDGPTEPADLDRTEANRALLRQVGEAFMAGRFDLLPEYYADSYIQHNPMIGDGVDSLLQGMKALAEHGRPMRISQIHRQMAEGDFVLFQTEGTFGGPAVFYDLFRVANGKIAEHWDVIAELPDPSTVPHDNGLF